MSSQNQVVRNSIKRVSGQIGTILSKYDGQNAAYILCSIASIRIQRIGLPNDELGAQRARGIFEDTLGLGQEFEECIEYVDHGRETARRDLQELTPECSTAASSGFVASTSPDARHEEGALASSDDASDESEKTEFAEGFGSKLLPQPVYLLEFARSPMEFERALKESPELHACRHALEVESFSPTLRSGATVLVRPDQYSATTEALKHWNLKPRHVIVAAEIEDQLTKAMANIGQGVVVKDKQFLPPMPAVVKRTFIDIPIASSLRSEPVTTAIASTTDANARAKFRPRKA